MRMTKSLCNHCDESHQPRVQVCGESALVRGSNEPNSPRVTRMKMLSVRRGQPKSLDDEDDDRVVATVPCPATIGAQPKDYRGDEEMSRSNCLICRTECGDLNACQRGSSRRGQPILPRNPRGSDHSVEVAEGERQSERPISLKTKRTEVPEGPPERCRRGEEDPVRRGQPDEAADEPTKRIPAQSSRQSPWPRRRSPATRILSTSFPFILIALLFLSSGMLNLGSVLGRGAILVAGSEMRARDAGTKHAPERGVCQSMDIRNSADALYALKDCRVIEGFLQISLIDKYEPGSYDNHTYPLLTEITGFLLIFRVNGLTSIGQLFPNLAIIRGNELFINYALVIYEVFHLEEIALKSLVYIGRGAVRFEKNPLLCFTETIEWKKIAHMTENDANYLKFNRKENECPVCPGGNSTDTRNCPMVQTGSKKKYLCWNVENCQRICPPQCKANCDALGNCCDESCIGGCSIGNKMNCTACNKFSLGDRPDRKCVDSCPVEYFAHMDRRCVTRQECLAIPKPIDMEADFPERPYIPFEYELNNTRVATCNHKCPKHYELQADRRSCKPCPNKQCKKYCEGAKIDSISAAQRMDGCDIVTGTLEIQIRREGGGSIVKELEKFLSGIEEIYGELKIARSDPFLSLGFMKNLKVIRGVDRNGIPLDNSLVLLDNENLEDLWNEGQRVSILSGRLLFHNNPKLCLNKIAPLESMVSPSAKFNLEEFAKNSNGDRTACNVTKIDVKVDKIMPKAATISWRPVVMDDARSLIGYVIYYKAARFQNVTMLDGRDACGYDGWQNDDVVAKTNSFLFTHLEPYTQYAFYVKTYQIAVEKTGGQSDIMYFTTEPSQPEMIRNLRVVKGGAHEVTLEWDPPKRANGNLTVYIITLNFTVDNDSLLSLRDYCQEKWDPTANLPTPGIIPATPADPIKENPLDTANCDCDKGSNLNSQTDAENQINFEDALHNRVYVKRSQSLPPASQLRRRRALDGGMALTGGDNSTIATPPVIFFPKDNPETQAPQTLRHSIKKGRWYTYIYKEVAVPTTTVHLEDLRHYSVYTISIIACRSGPVPNNCSGDVIYSHRTDALPGGDDIMDVALTPNPRNGSQNSVALTWDPPKEPNSLVLAYTIRYKNTLIEHSTYVTMCITDKVFNANNRIYNLKLGTENGNYSIQVQASSLGGFGNFTDPIFHKIEIPSYTGWYIGGVLILLLLMGSALAYFYLKNKKVEKDRRLFAEVNADYDATPYIPDEYEIPRERVKRNKELGQGSFGMVYAGAVQLKEDDPTEIPCAIKTVNDSATDGERMNFLKEAHVMKAFHTPHVVQLLGVVSKGDPPLVVMELMARGDLKGYLRAHRPDGVVGPDGEAPVPPSVRQILQMAIEIADGMAYLSMKKFVHRDLAARNCMVAEDLTVKIGDFGMTRDIYERDYYRKGDKGLLPVRWMSPESLKDGVFTTSNDVFSYGVVLWEMATLASQPYQGLSNDQVLRYVIDGGVMERPENCPDKLYQLMRRCWEHRPTSRPTFLDIVEMLLEDVNNTFVKNSFYFSEEGEALRYIQQQNENHHPDEGTTLLRPENELSHDNARENFYADMPNNNNNSRRLLEETGGAMPIIKPAQSPLRFLHGKSGGNDYKESKF